MKWNGKIIARGALVPLLGSLALTATPSGNTAYAGYEGPDTPAPSSLTSSKLTSKTDVQLESQKVKPVYVKTSSTLGIWIPAGPNKPGSHPQFFGKVKDGNGRWVICSQAYLDFRTGKIVMLKKPLRAQRQGGSVIIKTAINKYFSTANTPVKAAALNLVAYSHTTDNRFQGDKSYYRHRLGKSVTRLADHEDSWAASHHGTFRASAIKWKKDKAAVGETNVGRFTLKSASGKPLSGYLPEVSCPGNTYIESVRKTNKKGESRVTVHSKDTDSGHNCRYWFTHLPDPKRSLTASPKGFQQLTTGPVYTKVGNHGSFGNEHAKGSFTEECGNSCGTTVPMSGKVKAPAGGWNTCATAKVVETGNTVVSVTVAAGSTKSVSFTVPNGDLKHLQWTFRYCHGDQHTSAYTGSKFKIDCPPAPGVQLTMSCDCNGVGNIPLTVTKPDSGRTYKMWALDGSNTAINKTVLKSGANDFTLKGAESGDVITIKVTAGGKTWSFKTTAMSVSVS